MKKILVTTDFSHNSEAAIHYALNIGKLFSADVEIFNSFVSVPAIGIDGGPGVMNETMQSAGVDYNKKNLDELVKNLPEELTKGIDVTSTVSYGDPVLTISKYAKDHGHELIVMGTQGESRFEEMLFGSTSVDVMKQAICPVLAIPPEARYHGISRIVYATDLEEKDIGVISRLCELATMFDAEVIVFHAFGEDNLTAQEEADEFNEMLHESINYPKLKKESTTYGDSYDAILEVIKKDLANLIVMREKKRGIFSRLFHPDIVKRINYHTTIPLLTFNDNSLK